MRVGTLKAIAILFKSQCFAIKDKTMSTDDNVHSTLNCHENEKKARTFFFLLKHVWGKFDVVEYSQGMKIALGYISSLEIELGRKLSDEGWPRSSVIAELKSQFRRWMNARSTLKANWISRMKAWIQINNSRATESHQMLNSKLNSTRTCPWRKRFLTFRG